MSDIYMKDISNKCLINLNIIIKDSNNNILLYRCAENNNWCIPHKCIELDNEEVPYITKTDLIIWLGIGEYINKIPVLNIQSSLSDSCGSMDCYILFNSFKGVEELLQLDGIKDVEWKSLDNLPHDVSNVHGNTITSLMSGIYYSIFLNN